jgi:hypothetical protein
MAAVAGKIARRARCFGTHTHDIMEIFSPAIETHTKHETRDDNNQTHHTATANSETVNG